MPSVRRHGLQTNSVAESWKAFLATREAALAGKTSRLSLYRSAFRTWFDFGHTWPDEPSLAAFHRFCRFKYTDEYASARLRVIKEWAAWLVPNWPDYVPAPSALDGAATKKPERVKGGVTGPRMHPDDLDTLLGAIGKQSGRVSLADGEVDKIVDGFQEKVYGGEPSEDYWATVIRHISTQVGAETIAEICGTDRETAEKLILNRKFPRHARPALKRTYTLLLLRDEIRNGYDVDDLVDQIHELECGIRGPS